ncbi:hypothetical protein [Actinomadura sp. 9N407]|uniref:hypothetical protein n=1 Tax=Actinomadura sp. 9N407 TaxID=3375154 RepID=UPI0037A3FF20
MAAIIERVLRTIDQNPEIIRDITRGAGSALRDIGTGTGQKPERPERADVEITATARADELVFREAPEVDAAHRAEPEGESAAGSTRTNLPDQVRAGTTYRDVRIDFRVAAELPPTLTRGVFASGHVDPGEYATSQHPGRR